MSEIDSERAIAIAQAELGLAGRARAWRVRRLDRDGDDYFLVVVGDRVPPRGVAAVGVARGELRTRARLAGTAEHVSIDEARARELAAGHAREPVELVWRPCAQSRSPLYPLWRVGRGPQQRFVALDGQVFAALGDLSPGG